MGGRKARQRAGGLGQGAGALCGVAAYEAAAEPDSASAVEAGDQTGRRTWFAATPERWLPWNYRAALT